MNPLSRHDALTLTALGSVAAAPGADAATFGNSDEPQGAVNASPGNPPPTDVVSGVNMRVSAGKTLEPHRHRAAEWATMTAASTTAFTSHASGAVPQEASPEAARGDRTASAEATEPGAVFDLPAIASPGAQKPARLIVGAPLPEFLARGLVVIQYRAENLRIVPVFGPAALEVKPRVGHVHVTVDNAAWHWADAGGEPLIVKGLEPGPHSVRIDLADPTHRVIDSQAVHFEIPSRAVAR